MVAQLCAYQRYEWLPNHLSSGERELSDNTHGDTYQRNQRRNSPQEWCEFKYGRWCPRQFAEYYSERGQAATGQKPGSGIVIRESVFTEADNPDLVAVYPTYKDYLFAEHMAQYPTEFGTMLQDGKTNTNLIGRLTFEDIYGKTQYRYPAARRSPRLRHHRGRNDDGGWRRGHGGCRRRKRSTC